jgi:hypothetical protein
MGRHFQDGRPIDIAELSRLIEARRAQQPQMGAEITDLVQAIRDEMTAANRDSALRHFRAAIELASDGDKAWKIGSQKASVDT